MCAQSPEATLPFGQAPTGWPADVAGWAPVKPGGHPRLIFRKTDLPELRKRAQTPESKAIVERCEALLKQRFTLWNAAGAAFLYQVTGDKSYADQAGELALKAVSGAKNPDGRYTWPGDGHLRAGPAMSGIGLAYDMAYDGWDEAMHKKVAEAIVANRNFEEIASRPAHEPGCNHWGAHSGGLGVALLALRGDPTVDAKHVEELLEKVARNCQREILEGISSYGLYYEGHYCGRISGNTGLIPFIQAYRVAAGKHLVWRCTHAEWLALHWVDEFARHGGKTRNLQRGMYARDPFGRGDMLSSGGDLAQGSGIITEKHRPAFPWLYNHMVQPGENKD